MRELAARQETPAATAKVEAAYGSKWWGLRVLAIRVRGHWGGKANKAWLVARASRPLPPGRELKGQFARPDIRWEAIETRAARRAVAGLLDASDWGWVLDLGIREPGDSAPDACLFTRMPDADILAWIAAEQARGDTERIRAALRVVFARKHLAGRADILNRSAASRDVTIAKRAALYLKLDASRGPRRR